MTIMRETPQSDAELLARPEHWRRLAELVCGKMEAEIRILQSSNPNVYHYYSRVKTMQVGYPCSSPIKEYEKLYLKPGQIPQAATVLRR